MKKLFLIALVALCSACSKQNGCTNENAINYDPSAEVDDGTCQYNGSIVFWNHVDDGLCEVAISVDGVAVGVITQDYPGAPNCGQNGCVTFVGKPKTYTVQASETDDCDGDGDVRTWNFEITLQGNSCLTQKLN